MENGEMFSPTKDWFSKTKDTITVKFNLPGSTEFSQSISIDQKSTLREFKQRIEPVRITIIFIIFIIFIISGTYHR
jgi:hypothetical protein